MHRRRPTTSAAALLAAACAALACTSRASAANSSPTVPAAPAGVTPRFLCFNNGHYRSTSDASAWVDYSGINAMRVWAAANDYVSTTAGPTYGDGVTSQSLFDAD